MATQDFGLSFTVESPVLWNDLQKLGASSTILLQPLSFDKIGAASTIFIDLAVKDKYSAASTLILPDICDERSYLSGPPASTLSGPSANILSC